MSDAPDDEPTDVVSSNTLKDEIERILQFHVREYAMSHATIVGVLELVKAEVIREFLDGDDED